MSVINQMLRDLESRKETNPQLAQPDFSKKPNSALRWLVRLLVFLLAAGLGYWFWLMPTEPLAQAPEPHSVVVPEPLSAPAPRLLIADETGETVPELSDTVAQAKHGSVPQVAAKIAEQPMAPEPEPARPSEPLKPTLPDSPSTPLASESPASTRAHSLVATPKPIAKPAAQAKIQQHRLSKEQVADNELAAARQFNQEGAYLQAEPHYQLALRMKPALTEARVELARLLVQQGDWLNAQQHVDLGLKFSPKDTELHQLKAQILYQSGDAQGAWQWLSALDDTAITRDDYLMLKAGVASQLGHHELAYILYVRLCSQAPSVGRWWLGRALSAEYLARPDEARTSYQRALQSRDLSEASRQYAALRMKTLGLQ